MINSKVIGCVVITETDATREFGFRLAVGAFGMLFFFHG
jgi:hypothetical protein